MTCYTYLQSALKKLRIEGQITKKKIIKKWHIFYLTYFHFYIQISAYFSQQYHTKDSRSFSAELLLSMLYAMFCLWRWLFCS